MNRFAPAADPVEPYRLLSPTGSLAAGAQVPMSDERALAALELMTLARVFDDKAISLQRQGRFGTFSSVRGQEASIVGAATALDPARDWIVPQYRELPALVHHGLPLESFAQYFMGHPVGGRIPDDVRILPIQISLAAQLPQAVGLAWGQRLQAQDGVVVVFFGDGASSEGDFHESLNLAGVTRAPVVFLLQNNGWAISTPRSKQTAARTFAERAPGYGVEGVLVDGNDVFAVHEVVADAVERARAGEGPTLVEALTWRAGAHNTADDPTRYVTDADHAAWRDADPVDRLRTYLVGRGNLDDATESVMVRRCAAEVDRALQTALDTPPAGSDALFDHVYADPPDRVSRQRAAWAELNREA
jgi:pyruvate dehydrogenase E1 component alpha subunit